MDKVQIDHIPMLRYTAGSTVRQEHQITADDLERINALAPESLRADQVYVRSMYLCSSLPCDADGCCFTRNALEQIAGKIVGQSVLAGHNRTRLPLARFFKAAVVQNGITEAGEPVWYVRAWFYWLRETSGAKDLLLNIDGGIYREASLAWRYAGWRCSICLADNGNCSHRVGTVYNGRRCYRLIEQVSEVLEGSLVYKAADRNTILSGMHERGDAETVQDILLICESNDPLLLCLRKMEVVCEQPQLAEIHDLLQGAVEQLWLHGVCDPDAVQIAQQLLTDEGICIVESNSSDHAANEELSIFLKQDQELVRNNHPTHCGG
ncbi:MAG: hypothetical protein ACOX5R_04775 [bacterium]